MWMKYNFAPAGLRGRVNLGKGNRMEELIKRLERVIATGAPDKDGQHPISAETVLEVVKGLSGHGTNLAEVGTDCSEFPNNSDAISRQAAIDGLAEYGNGRAVYISVKEAVRRIEQLPPIQPVIVPCDYAKACNEATMDKLTSAVAYYDALEELRKHGYVLVDIRR